MSSSKTTQAGKASQGGNALAAKAVRALTESGFEKGRGMCQRWQRQVRQAVYGAEYDRYDAGTAEEARRLWENSPYAVEPSRGSVVGDILYKKGTLGQPAGHVGIRILGNKVAENSVVHFDGHDGRGTRSLAEFGKIDLIVRLPSGK